MARWSSQASGTVFSAIRLQASSASDSTVRGNHPVDVSIIVVNYNSLAYARECITSLQEWTQDLAYEVIVVDNASPECGVESLSELPRVKVICSDRNLGFARANNLGARYATGEYLLFLNPDTRLLGPAVQVMLQQARALPRAGAVGCKLVNSDFTVQTSCILRFPCILNRFFELEYLRVRWPRLYGIGPLFDPSQPSVAVEAISGACMLLRRGVFDKIGGFSEEYFMYSEDLDLCFQAARAGLINYYVGQASILHYGGKSGTSSHWQTVTKTRAELQFCERNYSRPYAFLFKIVLGLNAAARLLLLLGARMFLTSDGQKQRFSQAWARWSAIVETAIGRPRAQSSLVTATATHSNSSQIR